MLEALGDFAREGLTAATLREGGFRVAMREAPDLDVALGAARFHVEVARFRRRQQDDIDEAKLRGATQTGRLTDYGSPQECSEQVFRKLREKAARFPKDRPGVVAIYTDSPHQIEQLEVSSAMASFNDDLRRGRIAVGPFGGTLCLSADPPFVGFYEAIAASPLAPSHRSPAA